MRAHAIPLLGVEAGHGAADLQPLAAALGEARPIGLGEASRSPRPPRLPLPGQPGPDQDVAPKERAPRSSFQHAK